MLKKVTLLKPDQAKGAVKEKFEEIAKVKGDKYLTPTWGFWGLDEDIINGWWTLTYRLQMKEGSVSKKLMNCISLICAAEVNCPRCMNNHQTHLMEHFNMTADEVEDILDFENSDIAANEKAVLRFARNVAFGIEVSDEQFNELRAYGYDDLAIVEICSMAFLESSMAKHATIVARFEDGENWPKNNVPSSFYHSNVDR